MESQAIIGPDLVRIVLSAKNLPCLAFHSLLLSVIFLNHLLEIKYFTGTGLGVTIFAILATILVLDILGLQDDALDIWEALRVIILCFVHKFTFDLAGKCFMHLDIHALSEEHTGILSTNRSLNEPWPVQFCQIGEILHDLWLFSFLAGLGFLWFLGRSRLRLLLL